MTDGRRKEISIGKVIIEFKPTSLKDMNLASTLTGLIVQALKYFGQGKIDKTITSKIKRLIEENADEEIGAKLGSVPIWIAEFLKNSVIRNSNV